MPPDDAGPLRDLLAARPKPKPLVLQAFEQSEHELQIDCANMLRSGLLLPNVTVTGIDHAHSLNMKPGRNGRPIGLMEAQKRRARLIRAGIPDFLFWHDARGFAIELKTIGGELSDDQKVFLRELIASGIPVKVCWTLWQLFATIKQWGLVRPGWVLT